MSQHPGDGVGVEQISVVFQRANQSLFGIEHRDIKLRCAAIDRLFAELGLVGNKSSLRDAREQTSPGTAGYSSDRALAVAPPASQRASSGEHKLLSRPYVPDLAILKAGVTRNIGTQHQSVDKQPD